LTKKIRCSARSLQIGLPSRCDQFDFVRSKAQLDSVSVQYKAPTNTGSIPLGSPTCWRVRRTFELQFDYPRVSETLGRKAILVEPASAGIIPFPSAEASAKAEGSPFIRVVILP
jgi:hypothetical protein